MIISHRLYAFYFTNDDFDYDQMMFFIHLIHYKVYLTALKNSKLKLIV